MRVRKVAPVRAAGQITRHVNVNGVDLFSFKIALWSARRACAPSCEKGCMQDVLTRETYLHLHPSLAPVTPLPFISHELLLTRQPMTNRNFSMDV